MKTIFDDTKDFLTKFNLYLLDKPGIHPEIITRINHIQEELDELVLAVAEDNLEDVVDALIDIIYIASGTLPMCGVDGQTHWDEVHKCNMNKVRGKSKRNVEYDVCKPDGWVGPNHTQYFDKEYPKNENK